MLSVLFISVFDNINKLYLIWWNLSLFYLFFYIENNFVSNLAYFIDNFIECVINLFFD